MTFASVANPCYVLGMLVAMINKSRMFCGWCPNKDDSIRAVALQAPRDANRRLTKKTTQLAREETVCKKLEIIWPGGPSPLVQTQLPPATSLPVIQ